MQEIIIIAGPNGAGKTSFAGYYPPLAGARFAFINADEIAREIANSSLSQPEIDFRAGREMLARIEALVAAGAEFTFETTLASLTYARKIPIWRKAGYKVTLVYIRLPNPEASINRVSRRVAAGGHGIPEPVIRQRFAKGLRYLDELYKPIVDEWYVWDSFEGDIQLAEAWDR